MLAKPMADAWNRSSGYVRFQLRAGRYWAAGVVQEIVVGKIRLCPLLFRLIFAELMQEATR
jgi:hypothetical protein